MMMMAAELVVQVVVHQRYINYSIHVFLFSFLLLAVLVVGEKSFVLHIISMLFIPRYASVIVGPTTECGLELSISPVVTSLALGQ